MITKKNIFIAISVFFLILFPTIGILLQKKKVSQIAKKDIEILKSESKSDIQHAKQPKLEVTSVSPADGASKVPLDSKIEITFNQPDTQNDAEFSITPTFLFSISWQGTKMIITPRENYASGTLYTYIIKYQSQILPSKTYTFTTVGSPAPPADTQPEGAAESENAFERVNHPDIFLSNNLPHTQQTFSATSEFADIPVGHFVFTVKILKSTGKEDFIAWLKTLLFTDEQISRLDVSYQ